MVCILCSGRKSSEYEFPNMKTEGSDGKIDLNRFYCAEHQASHFCSDAGCTAQENADRMRDIIWEWVEAGIAQRNRGNLSSLAPQRGRYAGRRGV